MSVLNPANLATRWTKYLIKRKDAIRSTNGMFPCPGLFMELGRHLPGF